MKNWIPGSGLCLYILTAAVVVRAAGQPAPTNAPASTNGIGPRIQFDSLNYDFGGVRAGTKVTHNFVFTNTGDATLQITGVQPGCHCTTIGDWTHQVEPGKTGVIPIQFDSTGVGGPVYRSPSITCNDKSQPMVRFQLHGTVKKPVDVSSSFVFLSVAPDASEETNVVVHVVNNEEQPLMFSEIKSSQPTIAAELKTNVPGKNYDVIIKTVPPLGSANSQAIITLQPVSTNTQPIQINAIASVQPLVTVTPPNIEVPAGPLKTKETISVFLQNRGKQPLALSEPSINADGATASLGISRAGQVFTASVEFAEGFAISPGKALELSIKTDNPRFPVVKIPIRQAFAHPVPPMPVRVGQ